MIKVEPFGGGPARAFQDLLGSRLLVPKLGGRTVETLLDLGRFEDGRLTPRQERELRVETLLDLGRFEDVERQTMAARGEVGLHP